MKGEKIFGTILKEQSDWINDQIEKKNFFNKSHLLQEAIRALQKQEKGK